MLWNPQMGFPSVYSETTDELFFCVEKPHMSFSYVQWNCKRAILLLVTLQMSSPFCVIKQQKSYPYCVHWYSVHCTVSIEKYSMTVSFCLVKPYMSYPILYWRRRWAILLCSETKDEISFWVVKPQKSYPSTVQYSMEWNRRWAILLWSETANELSLYVVKPQKSYPYCETVEVNFSIFLPRKIVTLFRFILLFKKMILLQTFLL